MDSKKEKSAADDCAVAGLSRKDIFLLIRNKLNDGAATAYEEIEKAMSEKLQRPLMPSDDAKTLICTFLAKCNDKWKTVSRHEDKFLNKFSEWLSVFIPLEEIPEASKQSSSMGWPSVEFFDASERTKRRKTEELRAGTSTEELSYATQISLRASGKSDAAKVVQHVTLGSPSKTKKYRESIRSISETPLSPDAALSVIVETNLSKSQYQKIRNAGRENCSTLFPAYNKVREAKVKFIFTQKFNSNFYG